MFEGFGLVALGVGLLVTARAFAQDAGVANRKLLGKRLGGMQTSASVAFGIVVGLIAIVAGALWVIDAAV